MHDQCKNNARLGNTHFHSTEICIVYTCTICCFVNLASAEEPGAEQEVVVSREECESLETVLVSQEETTVVSIKCVAADVP